MTTWPLSVIQILYHCYNKQAKLPCSVQGLQHFRAQLLAQLEPLPFNEQYEKIKRYLQHSAQHIGCLDYAKTLQTMRNERRIRRHAERSARQPPCGERPVPLAQQQA